jgi:hypothetical protein
MKKLLQVLAVLLATTAIAYSVPPKQVDISKPLPKVIRTCCAFGVDVKVVMLPFMKMSSLTAPNLIGKHQYLGNKTENNGIIYTHQGGFIDLGHLRDIADLTAYFYVLFQNEKKTGIVNRKVGREGGLKTIDVIIPKNFNDTDIAHLAGKVAYDLSTWHEISTWYGASSVPFVAERYSSFSVEDAYSNLLGVYLSINSLLAKGDYEQEMTNNINAALKRLQAVATIDDTKNAMLAVKDLWWNSKAKFPSKNLLKYRQYDILDRVYPLTIDNNTATPPLDVPKIAKSINFNDIYQLKIKYNLKIPAKKIFGKSFKAAYISQNHFKKLVDYAKTGKYS